MRKKPEKELRITKVVLAVLRVVAGAGLLAMALCAPNALQALEMFDKRYRRPSYVNRVVERLMRRGFIKYEKRNGKRCLALTDKGERELARYEEGQLTLSVPKKWDGKWHILVFDIWEKRKRVRDELREFLRHLGFMRLQDSVWVYPYDCEEITALLKTRFRLGGGLLYIVAESIENDRWLRKEFDLE